MAKKRKTRAQKKLADLRHNFSHSILNQTVLTTKVKLQQDNTVKPQHPNTQTTPIVSYPYLLKDLSKTAILTTIILGAQVILYFLLINHTLKIPGLSY